MSEWLKKAGSRHRRNREGKEDGIPSAKVAGAQDLGRVGQSASAVSAGMAHVRG